MRQIKIKRLRPMDRFAKAPQKFAHHHFIEKTGLKKDSTDHPDEEDAQRSNPWPPAKPRTIAAGVSPASPRKQCNAR
jgi:hypothetical protein